MNLKGENDIRAKKKNSHNAVRVTLPRIDMTEKQMLCNASVARLKNSPDSPDFLFACNVDESKRKKLKKKKCQHGKNWTTNSFFRPD